MPTICELQIELKKLGVKGYSGKKKAQLEQMLNNAKNKEQPKATPNVKLLKNVEADKPVPNKAPPLSNNSLESLYKKVRSLKKRLKDNVNPNEKKVAESTLQKYKVAFKYVRTQFLDDIKKMKQDELKKLYRKLTNDLSKTKDQDDETIIGGKIAEVNKLLN